MMKVAYLSTAVPKKCGIATYTHHLRKSIRQASGKEVRDTVIGVQSFDEPGNMYPQPVLLLQRDDPRDYERMARKINESSIDVVSLQHEFGIFGGEAGKYVLDFVKALEKPLVTTFHTVFKHPASPYLEISKQLIDESNHITVMNHQAVQYLTDAYGAARGKISYIPHGTPGPAPQPKQQLREELGWGNHKVMLTFGLLGPSKGIEFVLETLPQVVKEVPNVLYVIAGQTHPEILKREGEEYRRQLLRTIEKLNLTENVVMMNRYMSESDIIKLITACDLYVTPYPGMDQITSGTLAYAVGAGCSVISTPYAYARDLLKDMKSLLIPYGDVLHWAKAITILLTKDEILRMHQSRIQRIGRHMQWSAVGMKHWNLFHSVIAGCNDEEGGDGLVAAH